MRILQVVTRRQRRGAEVFARDLADALVLRGHQCLLVAVYDPRDSPLEPGHARWLDLKGSPAVRFDPRGIFGLARVVRDFRPQVVQANGSDTLRYSVLARAVARRGWSLVYRNISVASRWLRGPFHRIWNRMLVAHVDHVVAVSRLSADDFAGTYGLDSSSITVIPQSVRVPRRGVRPGSRGLLRRLAGVPPHAPLVLHIGSFSPEKNHLWLLEAFRRVLPRHPEAHLVLVGDGPLRARVERVAGELDLGRRVHLLGVRPDAAELVADADLLVLPSIIEGLPGVVLEAAVQEVPTVATDVGGVSEAIRHGETGMLVPPGDMDGFASAAAELLEDPTRRREMGASARSLVERQFAFEDAVRSYEELYRALIRTHAPTRSEPPCADLA